RQKKLSCPMVLSLEGCYRLAEEAVQRALSALDIFESEADLLRALAKFVMERRA
ncbi:MAG: geranyl transferase, partial [Candidatus Fervidibacterota bacterium]